MSDDGMTDVRDFFGVDHEWANKACEILESDSIETWSESVEAAFDICESEGQKLYVAYQFGLAIGCDRAAGLLAELLTSGIGD